jgi:AcrR family transcriptional regulator
MKERTVVNDITDALFELLKTRELAKITITELIQKAGVCRSSFYRNFYLTEDVIRQYGSSMYEEINQTIPITQGGIYEHMLAVNQYIWTQREKLSLLEKRGLYYLLDEPILQQCAFQIQRLNVWTNRYQAEFYAGATNQVVRAWIRNNFAESPEEITKIIHSLLGHDHLHG